MPEGRGRGGGQGLVFTKSIKNAHQMPAKCEAFFDRKKCLKNARHMLGTPQIPEDPKNMLSICLHFSSISQAFKNAWEMPGIC